jgi:hypothetical protein
MTRKREPPGYPWRIPKQRRFASIAEHENPRASRLSTSPVFSRPEARSTSTRAEPPGSVVSGRRVGRTTPAVSLASATRRPARCGAARGRVGAPGSAPAGGAARRARGVAAGPRAAISRLLEGLTHARQMLRAADPSGQLWAACPVFRQQAWRVGVGAPHARILRARQERRLGELAEQAGDRAAAILYDRLALASCARVGVTRRLRRLEAHGPRREADPPRGFAPASRARLAQIRLDS